MVAPKRVAWITGASSGIGRALALRMQADGWTVVVSARRADVLADLGGAEGPAMVPLALDVTDAAAVAQAVQRIRSEVGPIDVAVLSAGTYVPMRVRDFSARVVQDTLALNTLGVAHCLEALLPAMLNRGRGRIVAVASLAGYRGMPTSSAYGASKAAVIHMLEALQPELAGTGVILQVANPGFVRTPLTDKNTFPMPFRMELDDAVAALYAGMQTERFEIVFPRSFALILKVARMLPIGLYLRLMRRIVPKD
jgi:NAD(P)-dependent dehydrogenase (short-subunit alcohol dehydrogenase family)